MDKSITKKAVLKWNHFPQITDILRNVPQNDVSVSDFDGEWAPQVHLTEGRG